MTTRSHRHTAPSNHQTGTKIPPFQLQKISQFHRQSAIPHYACPRSVVVSFSPDVRKLAERFRSEALRGVVLGGSEEHDSDSSSRDYFAGDSDDDSLHEIVIFCKVLSKKGLAMRLVLVTSRCPFIAESECTTIVTSTCRKFQAREQRPEKVAIGR